MKFMLISFAVVYVWRLSISYSVSDHKPLFFPPQNFSFFLLVFFVVYRILQGKKSFFLFIFFFCALFSFFIFERIFAFLGVTTALSTFIWKVSSGSNESGNSGGETSLPALESSSSSESLATFRAVIAAENEA